MKYRQILVEEFKNTGKKKMEIGKSICSGHESTVIYFVENEKARYYIAEINLTGNSYYFQTPCTYTPTFGMDSIDGGFAQDAEEYIVEQKLGVVSDRLKYLFDNKDEISAVEYMQKIGFPHKVVDVDEISEEQEKRSLSLFIPTPKSKSWWEFWK